ncbi:MAG: hypothetical protein ACJAWN_001283 [Neolewinella sp.]|jgi:hypothetical protein
MHSSGAGFQHFALFEATLPKKGKGEEEAKVLLP